MDRNDSELGPKRKLVLNRIRVGELSLIKNDMIWDGLRTAEELNNNDNNMELEAWANDERNDMEDGLGLPMTL